MEVKVISSERIRPSSPTPSHLKTFKLSRIDQLHPLGLYRGSINFFYLPPTNNTTSKLVDQLKVSLSKALTRFYPLAAGQTQFENNVNISIIECNDEGALFTHVQLSCHLSQFLKPPINHDLLYDDDAGRDVQIAVRFNVFGCGGICIGVRFLHKIIDGATISAFLKSWASAANATSNNAVDENDLRAASVVFPPKEMPVLLPPKETPKSDKTHSSSSGKENLENPKKRVWKRFVFDATAISTLKSVFSQNQTTTPSSFIVVSNFILKHISIASASESASTLDVKKKVFLLSFGVNMRPRIVPPLSQNSIGNMVWHTGVVSPPITAINEETMRSLVAKQREAITEINGDFLERFQGEGGYDAAERYKQEMIGRIFGQGVEVVGCDFNCWCRFGFNELDFGWGKPVWYCSDARDCPWPANHHYLLVIDTASGDGIEVQVMMDESRTAIIERDQEFLAFASIDPVIVP